MEKQMKAESGRGSAMPLALQMAEGAQEAGGCVLPWNHSREQGFNFNSKQHKYILLRFWSPKVQRESQGDRIKVLAEVVSSRGS